MPKLSVIVPTFNESTHLRQTVEWLQATLPASAEVVVVDDGSTDHSTDFLASDGQGVTLVRTERVGVAGARNRGAAAAKGQVLVFVDAHVDAPAGWWQPLGAALEHAAVGAVAPAISVMGRPERVGYGLSWTGADLSVQWLQRMGCSSYSVPLLPGGCLAICRGVFEAAGGFDAGMTGWGWEDQEISLRLWLLGYELRLVPEVTVAHLFRACAPYRIDWVPMLTNMLRLVLAHFSKGRVARVLEKYANHVGFSEAVAASIESDVCDRRQRLARERVRGDDWYFSSFAIPW